MKTRGLTQRIEGDGGDASQHGGDDNVCVCHVCVPCVCVMCVPCVCAMCVCAMCSHCIDILCTTKGTISYLWCDRFEIGCDFVNQYPVRLAI